MREFSWSMSESLCLQQSRKRYAAATADVLGYLGYCFAGEIGRQESGLCAAHGAFSEGSFAGLHAVEVSVSFGPSEETHG